MSTCTKWVDDGTIACTDWTYQASVSCNQWADHGSYQCQAWADEGSNQCQSWADEGSNQCQSWADEGYNECCDWAPCSWFCDALVWISNWVCQAWYWVANWVCQAWYWVANWVCQAWYWVANIVCVAFLWVIHAACVVWSWIADWVCVAWDNTRCLGQAIFQGDGTPPGPIKHIFVLMLENRAFDHMLGFAGVIGTDAQTGQPTHVDDLTIGKPHTNPNPNAGDALVSVSSPADFTLWNPDDNLKRQDPGHEFDNALLQLCGYTRQEDGTFRVPIYQPGNYPATNNSGFIASYFGLAAKDGVHPDVTDSSMINMQDPERIMKCYDSEQVPVITALAKEFAVCDRWFSSIPGPTWPNRFFIHAASSGGLDDSPSSFQTATSALFNGYRFENGTIYDSLEDQCFDWNVFMGDELPQVFAISGMTDRRLEKHFDDFADFSEAVNDLDFSVRYIFIEPNYGNVLPLTPGDFTCGNSQHPLDDITRGEHLIKTVYETIRNSPHWNESLLLVTYDEQGGFYDHVAPPPAVSPGDTISDPDNNHHNFDFTQLGVRVPAIVISPLIPRNMVDHTQYDHTSLLATAEKLFGLPSLTNRDAQANTFDHLLSLQTPRTDAPTSLPDPANSGFSCDDDPAKLAARRANSLTDDRPMEPILAAFAHVAFLRDYHHANLLARPAIVRRFLAIKTRAQAASYIQDVAARAPKPKRRLRRIFSMIRNSFRFRNRQR